jgi:CarD family transcriptional regulator
VGRHTTGTGVDKRRRDPGIAGFAAGVGSGYVSPPSERTPTGPGPVPHRAEIARMPFEIGDKAVYPAHGVGVVKDVESSTIEGEVYELYVLKILDNGMTIRVPTDNADAIGMREIIPKDAVEKVYEVLRDRKKPADKQTWNRRYREYMNKIKTGDPLEVAAVLRDLALLKKEKTLSFGERKMYDQAHGLIVQEVAVAKDVDESKVKKEIEKIFSK